VEVFDSPVPNARAGARGSVDEFTFRLNEGNVKIHVLDRIDSLLEKSVGVRITYRQLVYVPVV